MMVIDEPERAGVLLDPLRLRIVEALAEPGSATTLAKDFGLPRQRINYHLKTLEDAGLITLKEERRRRNCTEKVMQATARAFVVGPAALGGVGLPEDKARDRMSWSHLMGLAVRMIADLSRLRRSADKAEKKLATLSLDSEVAFLAPEDKSAFAEELTAAVAKVARKYAPSGAADERRFKLVVGAYPKPKED